MVWKDPSPQQDLTGSLGAADAKTRQDSLTSVTIIVITVRCRV